MGVEENLTWAAAVVAMRPALASKMAIGFMTHTPTGRKGAALTGGCQRLVRGNCRTLRGDHLPLALPQQPDVRKASAAGESRSGRVFATRDHRGRAVDPDVELCHGECRALRDPASGPTRGIPGAIAHAAGGADEGKIGRQQARKGRSS